MPKSMPQNVQYSGGAEDRGVIRYAYLYPCFGNYAVARGVFKFLSGVHRSNVLTLKSPGKQSISEMCFRSFFPELLLPVMGELVMMTLALK